MKIFLAVFRESIRSAFTFLYTAFSTNTDLRAAILFHFFQAITTRSNEKPEEVDLGEFLDRNVNLFLRTHVSLLLMIFHGRSEIGIRFEGFVNKSDPFFFEFFAIANLPCVGSPPLSIVSRRR
jgi:hypothetical protein